LQKGFSGLIFSWKAFQDKYFLFKLFLRKFFFQDTVMIMNAYFLSQSFSNPTGWQHGGESGNAFGAFNETTA
jgi:hypothetical protein